MWKLRRTVKSLGIDKIKAPFEPTRARNTFVWKRGRWLKVENVWFWNFVIVSALYIYFYSLSDESYFRRKTYHARQFEPRMSIHRCFWEFLKCEYSACLDPRAYWKKNICFEKIGDISHRIILPIEFNVTCYFRDQLVILTNVSPDVCLLELWTLSGSFRFRMRGLFARSPIQSVNFSTT